MQTASLTFGEWLPDLPADNNPGLTVATNVIPGRGCYLPFRERSVYSAALNDRCHGAAAFRDKDGNVSVYAGTPTKLYKLVAGSTAWVDKSGATYTGQAEDQTEFAQWSNTVIATNFRDVPQVHTLDSGSSFADLSASAPRARHICVSRNFVLLAHTNDSDGIVPQRLYWSALGDPTDFTPSVTTLAGYRDLEGTGGENQRIISGMAGIDLLIFQRKAIWRGTYVGTPTIWECDVIEGSRGVAAPRSVVQHNGIVYFLSEDGFYALSGVSLIPIGAGRVDKTILTALDSSYFDRVSVALDPVEKVIYWAYPDSSATAGNPNRIIAFNTDANRWSEVELTGDGIEILFDGLTIGTALDDIDALGAPYDSIDTIPFSLDSTVFKGGNRRLSFIDTDHKLGYFDGNAMSATIATGESHLFDSRNAYVTEVWPRVDAGTPRCAVGVRQRQTDAVTWGASAAMNAVGFCPVRGHGRYVRARVSLSASASWSQITGLDFRATAGGWR